jgi:hypothetical protein
MAGDGSLALADEALQSQAQGQIHGDGQGVFHAEDIHPKAGQRSLQLPLNSISQGLDLIAQGLALRGGQRGAEGALVEGNNLGMGESQLWDDHVRGVGGPQLTGDEDYLTAQGTVSPLPLAGLNGHTVLAVEAGGEDGYGSHRGFLLIRTANCFIKLKILFGGSLPGIVTCSFHAFLA